MTLQSPVHHAGGANIKGTPAMPASKVLHDLKVLRKRCDVLMLQEFRWPWYWRVLFKLLGVSKRWASSPGFAAGRKAPVRGAQGILWKRKMWKRAKTRVWLLHEGVAKVSESRFIRAVLLQDRATGLYCWFVSTHFVVNGDRKGDSALRKSILNTDITRLSAVFATLANTGYPVVCELDANIAKNSEAYDGWMKMLEEHDMRVHGEHGVEYMLTMQGSHNAIKVLRDFRIPVTQLETDHETRGLTFVLVA